MPSRRHAWSLALAGLIWLVTGQAAAQVVDVPTRPGVTQRLLLIKPAQPQAAVALMAGGHVGLRLSHEGSMRWGQNNFLVRTRALFADEGLAVAVLDVPSDRQRSPFLEGFRQTAEHAADLKAIIADGCWLCPFGQVPALMDALKSAPRKHVLAFTGGISEGDPCHAMAHHGFNGIEAEVVRQAAAWVLAR